MIQPVLQSERLSLRPFVRSDAGEVQRLTNDERIASVTANIPYPYPDGLAEKWISNHEPDWNVGVRASFAITLRASGDLLGAISLMHIEEGSAELGYWLGVDGWGKGFATEACQRIIRFAADDMKLQRVYARALTRNPASCRVLVKAGMVHAGQSEGACGYHECESIEEYEWLVASCAG